MHLKYVILNRHMVGSAQGLFFFSVDINSCSCSLIMKKMCISILFFSSTLSRIYRYMDYITSFYAVAQHILVLKLFLTQKSLRIYFILWLVEFNSKDELILIDLIIYFLCHVIQIIKTLFFF